MKKFLNFALDAAALLVSKATLVGLRLVTLYFGALVLERAQFGHFALAFTTAEICRFVCDWGTDAWSLRRFSDPTAGPARSAFVWVLRVRVVATALAIVSAWCAIHIVAPQMPWMAQACIAATAATSLWLNFGVNWLQARSALRPSAAVSACISAIFLVALWVLHARGVAFDYSLLALAAAEIVIAGMVVVNAARHAVKFEIGAALGMSPTRAGDWLRESTPIALASIAALFYSRFDQYFVESIASASELGDYMLAWKIAEPILFVFVAATSTIYTRTARSVFSNGIGPIALAAAKAALIRTTLAAFLVCATVSSVLNLLTPAWLSKYPHTLALLDIVLIALFFRIINQCLTALLQAVGGFDRFMLLNLFLLPVFVGSVMTLGSRFGVTGVAIGICAGEAVGAVTQFLLTFQLYTSTSRVARTYPAG